MIDWLAAAKAQQERFWAKVNKSGPVVREGLSPCWVWVGRIDKYGYGQFMITSPMLPQKPRQKGARPHRLVLEFLRGPIPSEMLVLHECDNPACCNPDHLRFGTQQENIDDMMRKGRYVNGMTGNAAAAARGERNGSAKLTAPQVIAMREARKSGASFRSLARQFGVSRVTVSHICAGKLWTHLLEPKSAS